MKLSLCHVDITGTAVQADLGPCHTSIMKCMKKSRSSKVLNMYKVSNKDTRL